MNLFILLEEYVEVEEDEEDYYDSLFSYWSCLCLKNKNGNSLMFDNELTDDFLEQKFTKDTLEDRLWDKDKEIYVDFIFESNSIIEINYG